MDSEGGGTDAGLQQLAAAPIQEPELEKLSAHLPAFWTAAPFEYSVCNSNFTISLLTFTLEGHSENELVPIELENNFKISFRIPQCLKTS